jgi:hypothetical protein
LTEQLAHKLLFRWVFGMNMDEQIWVPTGGLAKSVWSRARRTRTARLPSVLLEALNAHRKEQDKNREMLGARYCDKRSDLLPRGGMFLKRLDMAERGGFEPPVEF